MTLSKEEVLREIDEMCEYRFSNANMCWEIVQGKGAAGFTEGNKRLALLGDALLRSQLLRKWYPTGQTTGKSLKGVVRGGSTRLVGH